MLSLFVFGFANFQKNIVSYSTAFILGVMLFCASIYISNYNSQIYLFVFIISLCFMFDYIGEKSSFMQLIICTSIVGSLCIVRGLSILIDNFPDEQYLVKLYSNEEFSSIHDVLSNAFEANSVMFCIFASVGLVIQYLFKSKYEEEEDLSNGENNIDKYGNETNNESNILRRLWS